MNRWSRRTATAAALALAALRGGPAVAQTEGFQVVVNQSNPVTSLSKQQVAEIFMKHATQFPQGGDVHPVDQPAVATVRDLFSRSVHGKSASAVASWWGQQMFSGRAVPPPQRPTDRAVITFVREDAAAIGYVTAGTPVQDVKVVHITP